MVEPQTKKKKRIPFCFSLLSKQINANELTLAETVEGCRYGGCHAYSRNKYSSKYFPVSAAGTLQTLHKRYKLTAHYFSCHYLGML